jgi:replicative DNA helicase
MNKEQFDRYKNILLNPRTDIIETGWRELDSKLVYGGFHEGFLCSVLGKSSVGKTYFVVNWIYRLIRNQSKVLFFSMEMNDHLVMDRLLQLILKVNISRLAEHVRENSVEIEDMLECMDLYRTYNIHAGRKSIAEMDKIVSIEKPDFVFIDYLQLIKMGVESVEAIQSTMQALDDLAENRKTRIITLVQLRRINDSKTRDFSGAHMPLPEDARGGSVIEDTSDLILGLWRPDITPNCNAMNKGKIMMAVLKNKFSSQNELLVDAFRYTRETGELSVC